MQEIDISKITVQREKKTKKGGPSLDERINEILHKEIRFGGSKLSDKKKQQLYGDLSMLILSGIDLKNAFEIVRDNYTNINDKNLIEAILKKIIEGESLSNAFLDSGLFSQYEYFSIQIGEETANLDKVLSELNMYFKRKIEQRKKLVNAFTYPAIVIVTAILAVTFMLNFIVPMFAQIYSRFNHQLPQLTLDIIKLSHLLPYTLPFIVAIIIAAFAFVKLAEKKEWYKRYRDTMLMKMPIYGPIIKDIQLSRFFLSMEMLLSAKIPLLQGIKLARNMVGFYPLNKALGEVEKDIVAGTPLNKSMSRFEIFSPRVVSLIRVGEEVNRLQNTFAVLKDIYQSQVEQKSDTISSILEPLLVLFVGVFVAIILISMYLPIFQISSTFNF